MKKKNTVHGENAGGAYAYGSHSSPLPGRAESGKVERQNPNLKALPLGALIDALTRALAARRYDAALERVVELLERDPDEARWHEQNGELLRMLDRAPEAAAAYREAARRYDAQGLSQRASSLRRVAELLAGVRK